MRLFFLILRCLLIVVLFSQKTFSQLQIRGKIINAETKVPIAGASIYLNSTTVGAISNEMGFFVISQIPPGEFKLIASNIGFQTFSKVINTRSLMAEIEIQLKPKTQELESFSVAPADPKGWFKWGELFKKLFIGDNRNALECKIENPEILNFRKNRDNSITVYASQPLKITNFELGYQLEYQLEEFYFNFGTQLLNYTGYVFFKDMEIDHPNKIQKYEDARLQTYKGSFLHFKRAFYANRLKDQGFVMKSLGYVLNQEKARAKQVLEEFHNGPVIIKSGSKTEFEINTSGAATNLRSTSLEIDSTDYFRKKMLEPDFVISNEVITADSIGFAADSTIAGMFFTDSLEISYTLKEPPGRYKSLMKVKDDKYLVSQFVFVSKQPIYILKNGYHYKPLDLKITGFWAWWESIATLLPFDYLPRQ